MKAEDYCALLAPRLRKYFDLADDGMYSGKKFDLAAVFCSRENQTLLSKNTVMDYLETREICLVSAGCTPEFIAGELASLPELAVAAVTPSRHHKSTVVTRVFAVNSADKDTIRAVKHFHFSKAFRFYFWGWTECRTALVDLTSGKVYTNTAGRRQRKIFVPV